MAPEFTFRGLEMHGIRMWQPDRLREALDFASAHDMTALVLHENTIIHDTTFPKKYFDDSKHKGYSQVRCHQNGIYARQSYLEDVLKLAGRRNLEVWVEVKELEFPDEVVEKFPHVCKNGIICPTEPVWLEYIQVKLEEFFELFPEIAGIIVSPGSPETRAYLSAGKKCSCDRCRSTDFSDWCHSIIMAMYQPIKAHGKKLAVRDFVYSPDDHERLTNIINRTPQDVIFCLKVTPMDYWPTFPHNQMIGKLRDRVQWIEYEVFGQYFGWGVCPAIVLEDIKDRFSYVKSQGVSGALIRTEWENVLELSCFDNLNKINLIGAVEMAKDLGYSAEQAVGSWLREDDLLEGVPEDRVDLAGLTRFLLKTWPIMEKAIYIDGFVFASCSRFPLNMEKAWFILSFWHSLAVWDPSKADRIRLEHDNVRRLLAEKDQAYQELQEFLAELDRNDFGLPASTYRWVKNEFQYYEKYVRGFRICAQAILLAKALTDGELNPEQRGDFVARLTISVSELSEYRRELQTFQATTSHPYYVYLLLNHHWVGGILVQVEQVLAEYSGK